MAAPVFLPQEKLMLPGTILRVDDANNIAIIIFDQVVNLAKDDLKNWAQSMNAAGLAPGDNVSTPVAGGFVPATVFQPGRSLKTEWRNHQIAAGKKNQ